MTVGEFKTWLEENKVPDDAQMQVSGQINEVEPVHPEYFESYNLVYV
jgi:hypothetical protein